MRYKDKPKTDRPVPPPPHGAKPSIQKPQQTLNLQINMQPFNLIPELINIINYAILKADDTLSRELIEKLNNLQQGDDI